MIDFLIVGGGIAGISAAASLAPMGKTVVLEREDALAYHASGRSAALFEENYVAPTVVDLNRAGKPFFLNDHPEIVSPRGILMVAKPGEEDVMAVEAAGFKMDEISIEEACAKAPLFDPSKLSKAAFSPAALDIDTDLLIQTFARQARSAGAEIHTKAEVTAIKRTRSGWSVVTPSGPFEAKILVNAAGAWADQLAQLAGIAPIGLQPYRRSMARVPAPEGVDISDAPMLFGVKEAWYAKPDAGALIVSPADEDPMDPCDAWAEDETLAIGIDGLSQVANFEVTRMLANWAGLRTFAPDRTLVIGPDPTDEAFVWCAGQGGYGFQTAPGASQLLAEVIGGKGATLSKDTVAALSPARFR